MNAPNEKLPVVALIKVHGGKTLKPFFWFVLVDADTCESGRAYKARLVGESDNSLNIALLEPGKPVPKQAQNHSLTKSQLRYLAKGYPQTVKLFQESLAATDTETRDKLRAECFAAYCVETTALSGELVKPARTLAETVKVAQHVANAQRRGTDSMDLEIFELINHRRDYRELKPLERLNALRRAFGHAAYQCDRFGKITEQTVSDLRQSRRLEIA